MRLPISRSSGDLNCPTIIMALVLQKRAINCFWKTVVPLCCHKILTFSSRAKCKSSRNSDWHIGWSKCYLCFLR